SDAVNWTKSPIALSVWTVAAPASAQPSHPDVFVSELPVMLTLTGLIQVAGWVVPGRTLPRFPMSTIPPEGVEGEGELGVVGFAAPGGVVGAGVAVSSCEGTLTMNASRRLPPTLLVHTKYCPVTSRLPFGIFP